MFCSIVHVDEAAACFLLSLSSTDGTLFDSNTVFVLRVAVDEKRVRCCCCGNSNCCATVCDDTTDDGDDEVGPAFANGVTYGAGRNAMPTKINSIHVIYNIFIVCCKNTTVVGFDLMYNYLQSLILEHVQISSYIT